MGKSAALDGAWRDCTGTVYDRDQKHADHDAEWMRCDFRRRNKKISDQRKHWNIKDWLEDTIAEGTDISERVDRALYPFKFDYTLEEEMFRGNGDRYAIYHVDEDTPGKQHLFMNMAMVKEDGITIDAANYKCVYSTM